MDSEEIRHELPGAYEFRKARWAVLVLVLAVLASALPELMEAANIVVASALIAAVVYGAIGFHLRGKNHY
jgi:hypothetical protein